MKRPHQRGYLWMGILSIPPMCNKSWTITAEVQVSDSKPPR
jgi:hypothetical protein